MSGASRIKKEEEKNYAKSQRVGKISNEFFLPFFPFHFMYSFVFCYCFDLITRNDHFGIGSDETVDVINKYI